jgi:ribosomal protein S18 acetylase RimI-like enzyme
MTDDRRPVASTVRIRTAVPADAAALAEIARRTYEETFAPYNDPADMALYLSGAYGLAQQSEELADGRLVTLLADTGEGLAGYAQLRDGTAPACVTGGRPLELWRFYVDRPWHGRGLAQRLMQAVLEEAGKRGAGTLWLGVWERNERAQAFYRKCGFLDVGSHPFMVGTDRQTDRIMTRPLP